MKKTIQKEVVCCDKCQKEEYVTPCLECGTEFCFDCKQKNGKSYSHAVYFTGSGDGFYCHSCDSKLMKSGKDIRYNAHRVIESLKNELIKWNADFKKRKDSAEEALKIANYIVKHNL